MNVKQKADVGFPSLIQPTRYAIALKLMNQQALNDPNAWKQQAQHIPLKRAGEPQEIAHAAVFLASSDAKYIHGTTIFIDGGLTQNMGQGA